MQKTWRPLIGAIFTSLPATLVRDTSVAGSKCPEMSLSHTFGESNIAERRRRFRKLLLEQMDAFKAAC